VLCLPESDGVPFELEPAQKFIVGSLFGWKKPNGFRRFGTAYVEQGKGNGKSPLAGGIGLYMMIADGEMGAYCFAAANTREQADILFQDAVKMVDASPKLRDRIQKSGKQKVFNLAYLPTGSYFRPVSAEHKGLDGKRVQFAALDEVHESTAVVVDKMRAGTKGRKQALIFEITNSGFDRESVCFKHHEYSRHILEGTLVDEEWFAYICALDIGDDYKDPGVWLKANPLLGVSVTQEYLEKQVREAAGMPSQENIVKRLNFCIWTDQQNPWVSKEVWDTNSHLLVNAEALKGHRCYAALDLALTRDLSALVLVFPPEGDRDYWVVLVYYWIPQADMAERVARDHVPYDVWAREEKIFVTPGNVTDHDFIEAKIKELSKQYQFIELAFDPSRAVQLVTHLQEEGLNLVEFPQTAKNFNVGVLMMEKMLLEQKFGHGNHPILDWNRGNAATVKNANGEVKFDKRAENGRIDGIVAAAMAFARANAAGEAQQKPSIDFI
jgi:phage terminase large subunit-like protein